MSASTEKKNRQAARDAGTDKKLLAAQEEAKKQAKSKLRWTLGTIGVILLIAAILFLNSGLLYRSTAYTVGDRNYSASEVSYRYASQYQTFLSQYGSYASMFGVDSSAGLAGLRTSPCSFAEGTWRDYFLSAAETQLTQMTAVLDYARDNGIALDEDELAEVKASFDGMDEYAVQQGYANLDKLFAANYGTGVNTKLVTAASEDSTLAAKALQQVSDSFQYTDDELKAQYESYNGEKDLFTYASYYVEATVTETPAAETDAEADATAASETQVTPEALAEAKAIAQDIEKAYNDATGDDYTARLTEAADSVVPGAEATEHSAVSGSSLGSDKEWLMDASRKGGELAVTEDAGGSGYYVTVFLGRDDNSYKTAQVRHILIRAEAEADGTYTDEAKAAAKAQAEDILAQYKAGDQTEDSFAALAEQYSSDTGSNTNGGLYDNIAKGQMVEQFEQFCFDDHKAGDTAIVYGESSGYAGYHVMYYVGEGQPYCDYLAETDLRSAELSQWLSDLEAGYTSAEGFGIRFVG